MWLLVQHSLGVSRCLVRGVPAQQRGMQAVLCGDVGIPVPSCCHLPRAELSLVPRGEESPCSPL